AGLEPGDIRSLEDVARLPFTVKDDLRETYPFGMFARPRTHPARLHASSRTTGKPTVVGYTAQDLTTWSGLMARSLACAGARPGDVIHNAYGYGLFTGGLGTHYRAQRPGAPGGLMSGGATERQIVLIQDFGARVLCCTPSYALAIAEVAEKQGVDPRQSRLRICGFWGVARRKSSLRIGIFGAEPWSEAMRKEIEGRIGVKAIDIYGLSEILGPGVAGECEEAQARLHGREDYFLLQL